MAIEGLQCSLTKVFSLLATRLRNFAAQEAHIQSSTRVIDHVGFIAFSIPGVEARRAISRPTSSVKGTKQDEDVNFRRNTYITWLQSRHIVLDTTVPVW